MRLKKKHPARMLRLSPPLLLVTTAAFLASNTVRIQAQTDGQLNLTVIHTNDIHSHVDPANALGVACTDADISVGNCYGGAARHKTLIQKLRAARKDSLLLNGGDEGTLFYSYYKGNVTPVIMNELGYDATTVGNHEWDDGPDTVGRFWAKLNMSIVCANIDFSKNPELGKLVKPYTIIEKYDVGLTGYITPTTGDISIAGNTVSFTDPVPAVQKAIDELTAKGVKRIFADPMYQGPYPTLIKNLDGEETLIVQAYCWGRFIGNLDISFNPEGKIVSWVGGPVLVEHSLPGDPILLQQVDGWRSEFEVYSKKYLSYAADDFNLDGCYTRDCYMGNFFNDAMLGHVRRSAEKTGSTPWPDFAFCNSGAIRSGIPKGNITVENVVTTSPFGNYVVQLPLTGQEVLDMLEGVVVGKNLETGKDVTSFIQAA
ncbi:hypothetical protein BGX29_010862, partial [Mortierella sp. GBA35]